MMTGCMSKYYRSDRIKKLKFKVERDFLCHHPRQQNIQFCWKTNKQKKSASLQALKTEKCSATVPLQ